MKIIFAGVIGRLPVGGHSWIAMQYLAGLQELGHSVVFLEDCGDESWVYDWDADQLTSDLEYPAAYIRACLDPIGIPWIYRAGDRAVGMPVGEFREICLAADLLIFWAVPQTPWRADYDRPRRRAYIDADPGFTQIRLTQGDSDLAQTVARCEHLFTVGQRVGDAGCDIPTAGRRWTKTAAPVCLSHWPPAPDLPATHFTSVMQWRGYRDLTHEGMTLGQKDREFPKFIDLPRFTTQPLRIALTGAPPEDLTARGWDVVSGWRQSRTPDAYRSFIQQSRAEFGVAKHGYVVTRGGWFSDRSVCYLASGRPVLLEDTGLADWLPLGEGVVTFQDLDGAVRGIEAINGDYERHRIAARRLAEEYFASQRVLPQLLEVALN